MSTEGSIPSGRAAPESLENQQLTDGATGRPSSVWSGLGPKVGQQIRCKRGDLGQWAAVAQVQKVAPDGVCFSLCGSGRVLYVRDRGKTWDFTLEDLALMDDPHATHGKGGVPDLPAVPEEVKRCKGLAEMNHTFTCDAVLGPGEGDQCAHCQNMEAQIRREDQAVEEGEARDAQQAVAYEGLLRLHRGDARAVVAGVLRTLVAANVVTAEEEKGLHEAVSEVTSYAFDFAEHLQGVPLVMFWSLLADMASAERNSLRRANAEAYKGCA